MKRTKIIISMFVASLLLTLGMNHESEAAARINTKVTVSSVSSTKTSVTIKWKKRGKKPTGYQVYRKTTGKWRKVRTTKGVSFANYNLRSGTKYYFKVRAYKQYKKKGKKRYKYGSFSKVVGIATKANVTVIKPKQSSSPSSSGSGSGSSSGGSSGGTTPSSSQTCEGSFSVSSAPGYVNKYNSVYANLSVPTNGTVSCSTNNSSVATAYESGKKLYMNGGSSFGSTTITATFTPNAGCSYSGNRTVSVTVKNSVYPCNADGSYSIVYDKADDGKKTAPVRIGGVLISAVDLDTLPSNSVVKVDANNMASLCTYYTQTTNIPLYSMPRCWSGASWHITSSDNPYVAYICPDYEELCGTGVAPTVLDKTPSHSGCLYFVSAGDANVTYANGTVIHFKVTGHVDVLYNYINFIKTWKNSSYVKGKSDTEKVKATCLYIRQNFKYSDWNIWDAFAMFQAGEGDCWAGNSLMYVLCQEMGIDVVYRNAANDLGAGSGHRNCLITIGGVQYISDATPGMPDWEERSLITYTEYLRKYGR